MDVAAWRRETRDRLIRQRAAISEEEHRRASLRIEALLEEILRDFPPCALSAYWPFKNEVDLRGVMERLRIRGWTTALPTVVRKLSPLEFLRWTPDMEMDSGVYGIPIPRVRIPVQPEVMILPLVGFDAKNFRLGYGAGYYDITLASMGSSPRTIGIGFELARLETIHPQPTDIPLDLIVTEGGIQRIETIRQTG